MAAPPVEAKTSNLRVCGGERHRFFYGVDPTQPEYPSQQRAIEARVKGNYRVRCGHCGVSLMGELGHDGPITEIEWRHDADTWFGTFTVAAPEPRDG